MVQSVALAFRSYPEPGLLFCMFSMSVWVSELSGFFPVAKKSVGSPKMAVPADFGQVQPEQVASLWQG